jgi:hypothetical protein
VAGVANVPSRTVREVGRSESSETQPSRHLSSLGIRSKREEGVTGPSSLRPMLSNPAAPASPTASERKLSTPSPFDDENGHDSTSDYSVSVQDKRPRSSMLHVPGGRQVNDDGISEMSISSQGSNRKSRLNQRASDEISRVSSLNENDDFGNIQDARVDRGSSVYALPQIDDD